MSYNSFAPSLNGRRQFSYRPQRGPVAQPARLPDPETTIAIEPQHPHPDEDPNPAQSEGSSGSPTAVAPNTEAAPIAVAPNTEPNSARKYLEHPLQTILGTVAVLLLGLLLTQTNDRISRLEDKVDIGFAKIDERFAAQDAEFDERFAAQDAKFDERFARIDERFAAQDARFDEINLKLIALIAALNATAEVEAALDGRLLDPNAAPNDNPAN